MFASRKVVTFNFMLKTLCLSLLPLLSAQQQPVAITGAMVVDGTGAAPRKTTVLLRNGKIAGLGGDLAVPTNARVIDATGKTLVPGFFDVHTHLPYSAGANLTGDWPKNLKAYLYCGVTSVVDFGTYGEMFEPMRRLLRTGAVAGPHIQFAARMTTPGGHGAEAGWGDFFSIEVSTAREATAKAKKLMVYKPDAIKVFTDGWRYDMSPDLSSMEPETLTAIVEEAHKAGIPVLTHTVTLERAKIAAQSGVDVIAHGIGNAPTDSAITSLMKQKGTTYAPTLAVFEPRPRNQLPPLLEMVLEPAMRAIVKESSGARASAQRLKRWENLQQSVAAMRDAGVPVATGTDAGVTGTYHGWSTLRELELLVDSGLTPLQAITAATGVSARAVKMAGQRGTIAPGMTADLVLLGGDPLRDIRDIEKIERVFLSGVELDRAQLARDIAKPEMTPLPTRTAVALVDDMEGAEGRTQLGTLRVDSYDAGSDHSRMLFTRTLRKPGDHALLIQAKMSEKAHPYARLDLPLSPGAVEPVDASAFQGVRFEARGDGEYRLMVAVRSARDRSAFSAQFTASSEWKEVRIPFSALRQPASAEKVKWTARDMLMLTFEIARPAGGEGWLELDNVRFW
jgi:imidazolonepropionase-like amidohydrolase